MTYNRHMPLPPITCSKCGLDNPVTVRFCKRCHMPTRYECPSCHHLQMQGGTCEKCATDFTKYAAMLMVQMVSTEKQTREASSSRQFMITQILLLPITGVVWLFKYLMALRNGD
ncbi:MAG: hypothetical protein EXQ56_02480 [Acidobacteria bacterium]|nr:hypothetical protein [Acidobacteriota bacterium]